MQDEILIDEQNGVATLTLNRPDSMNALTYSMVQKIDVCLQQWSDDNNIKAVMIRGNGERAFCAGGDVLSFYDAMDNGTADKHCRDFFTCEYNMNNRMKNYPKPLVSLMHGVVMGGGVGASAHANLRVAFSDLKLALPECTIGLIPDVGSSYILSHAKGAIGKYIGLCGVRLSAQDAVYCGFADVVMDSADWTAIKTPDDIPSPIPAPNSVSPIQQQQAEIDEIFATDDVQAILQNLKSAGENYTKAYETMRQNSPLSMALFLQAYNHAKSCENLWQALQFEYRITCRLAQSPEFYEGIRAQLVDKDRSPKWHYDTIDENLIDRFTNDRVHLQAI